MKRIVNYFSKWELILWFSSMIFITVFFILFDRNSYFNLFTSLIGACALIFCAKGHPIGQLLILIFGVLYGIISYSFSYYGEMLTYVGMTCPMAVLSLVSWLRHPFEGKRSEVEVNRLYFKDYILGIALTLIVTVIFFLCFKIFRHS